MSVKNSLTAASPMDWKEANDLVMSHYFKHEYQLSLVVCIGIYTGLRISDILRLRWNDLLNKTELIIAEKKTGKVRKITLNEVLIEHVKRCHKRMNIILDNKHIFISRKGGVFTVQSMIAKLGRQSHQLRKTFARHIYNMSDDKSHTLVVLMTILKHGDCRITLRYIGIEEEEISGIYKSL